MLHNTVASPPIHLQDRHDLNSLSLLDKCSQQAHRNLLQDIYQPSPEPSITSLKHLLHHASKAETGIEFVSTLTPSGSAVETVTLSYRDLLQRAQDNAPSIRKAAEAMDTKIVLIHFETIQENIEAFWSVVFADLVPAMSTPLSSDPESRTLHLDHLESLLHSPLCITSRSLLSQLREASSLRVEALHDLDAVAAIQDTTTSRKPQSNEAKLPAALVLTSGSTGNAKAVALTVEQMVASVIGKAENWETDQDSVFLNWIGLDHVANLVEIHMHAMFCGAKQVHVQASTLLQDPLLFLRLISDHRVNYTFAPNFFLALLDKELISIDISDPTSKINLSCLRSIMSGGEANVVETTKNLTAKLNRLGAVGQVIRMGFGMTELCAACIYGMIDPVYEAKEGHQFASVGKPISTARVRIMTENGLAVYGETGDLEIAGPLVFKEYFNNPTATDEAFTSDGWFKTGDRAYIDNTGRINLAGRTKEVLNMNGIKFVPVDIETRLEKARLPNVLASYFAIFPDRGTSQQTESYNIVYGAAEASHADTLATIEEISRIASSVVSIRPNWVIPLSVSRLNKSSLGKLSRTKIQKLFLNGVYDDVKIETFRPLLRDNSGPVLCPQTASEQKVVEALSEMLDIPAELISTDVTIFELGVTSISVFRFERFLRRKFQTQKAVSVITFLSNPTVSAIADAISNEDSKVYNPVAKIQNKGDKTPLWLCHPASGNVLAFLPLARTVTDRPLYALTARGLRHNESLFSSIPEMCDTYFKHVKETQPTGPYALTGYSLGTTVAFELAKRLEANGDEVAFCAALDSPPNGIPLVEHLDWTAAAVLVSYFLELIAQDDVPDLITKCRGQSKLDIVKYLLTIARPAQLQALHLDPEQLLSIVNVTDNFGTMAKVYQPVGVVKKVDVFYCTPLHSIENNGEKWVSGHLTSWQDFSKDKIEFHECEGDHADMLNPTYVQGFEKRLKRVLAARGL